jgi:hypothetical protein
MLYVPEPSPLLLLIATAITTLSTTAIRKRNIAPRNVNAAIQPALPNSS